MDRFGDDNFLKLFKLSQMGIEYLVYTQNYLDCLTRTLDMQYKNQIESTKGIRDKIQQYNTELSNLKAENKMKQKTLSTYEYLIKIPKEGEEAQTAVKCPLCGKFFENEFYLKKHFAKRHPGEDFSKHFPTEKEVFAQQEKAKESMAEDQKKHQETLFNNLKKDLRKSMSSNVQTLEKEILKIKAEETKLQDVGKLTESE